MPHVAEWDRDGSRLCRAQGALEQEVLLPGTAQCPPCPGLQRCPEPGKGFPGMWGCAGSSLCPCPQVAPGALGYVQPTAGTCDTSTGWSVPQPVWTRSPPPAGASLHLCCQAKVRAKLVKAEPLAGPRAGALLPFYILKQSLGTFNSASMLTLLAVTRGKV